jgi:hypothetical protein
LVSTVAPQVMAWERGRIERKFIGDLVRLPRETKTAAVNASEERSIRYDAATRKFEVQGEQFVAEIPNDTVTITVLKDGNDDVSESDWELTCFPDGTCKPGGLQLSVDGRTFFISVSKNGDVTTGDTELPPFEDESWSAGEIETRG